MSEINVEVLARFERGITWFVVHSTGLTAKIIESYIPSGLIFQVYKDYPVFYVGMPVDSNFSKPDFVIGRLGSGMHIATHHVFFQDATTEATTVITDRYMHF